MSNVRAGLDDIRIRIERAARAAGRDPSAIRLVAVSKGQPAALIREAYEHGQRIFGENYAQELVAKAAELQDLSDLEWHMIGHLQTNKARAIAPIADMVHAVDTSHLAMELGRRASKLDRRLDVLIEVNVGGDPNKSGCTPSELEPLAEVARQTPGLRLCGLMTMPPWTEDPDGARRYFAALRSLQHLHGGATALPELSMGMSHDFEAAVGEGATLVRVGTAIFGARATAAR